tara:strand:+ start:152 stop:652 length:501 start_codon:yes stop_codon:yes gene_type:complete
MRFIAVFLVLMLSGCGVLQSSKDAAWVKEQRALNLDPYHVQSCGPEAMQKAFSNFGIHIELESLSHTMQSSPSCSNLLRDVLSVFNKQARQITFPAEIKKILKKNDFSIVSIKSLKDLDKNQDTALVLIRKKNTLTYHWTCFPNDKYIESFFGKDTLIEEIYLIKK